MRTVWLVAVVVILAVVSALALWSRVRGIPGLVEQHRLEGVFAPAYDPAGQALYFVHRESRGRSIGPGWEHLTPPARASVSQDVFSLRRLELASGRVEVLESWGRSPLVDRTISSYRGRIFTVPLAQIRVVDDAVEYRVRMSVPRQPTSETYRLAGIWRPGGAERAEWEQGHTQLSGYDQTPLNGRWEAIAAPGPESYPTAIVAFDASTDEVRVLVETQAHEEHHPGGVSVPWLHERARRSGIEGQMQRPGMSAKRPTLVARALRDGEEPVEAWPVFVVPEGEMRSGVFPDIEKALATPGTEVEKSMGSYVIHRDYENSARLNTYLGGGGRTFYLTYEGVTYEFTVQPGG